MAIGKTVEHKRLADSEARRADWKKWGPYVSERAWGTVREDYSPTGEAWEFFPHDHARSRAYRWNEDGIGGFCNRLQNIVMGVALWNEKDPILKERLFGLTGNEGNHGEDVKELYYYLDSTPTHSYAKMLYKYPQVAFPYSELVAENGRRSRHDSEFELIDALPDGFAKNRYFDIFIEYAKADQEDILCRITAVNRGPDPAPIHIIPQLWYRNTWSWGYGRSRPEIRAINQNAVHTTHPHLEDRWWYVNNQTYEVSGKPRRSPKLLFTENETNSERLWGKTNNSPYTKDGINDFVIHQHSDHVNPNSVGSKVGAHCQAILPPGERAVVCVRFTNQENSVPFADFDAVFTKCIQEADDFYTAVQGPNLNDDARNVQRQAFAGLMWSKQYYHYSIELWLKGDPGGAMLPNSRVNGRNRDWTHLYNNDVLSMPDKWEYPWYAAWDLAFHLLPIAMIDPEWAKRQIILILREWYMHPNGQIPAYEWAFDDVNPPVHAWAAWRVYKISRNVTGQADTDFLEKVFHKLLMNFTWWVNRKDADGNNVFQGGFLGLDNIGVFDRSQPMPTGGHMDQADGTAWMGMYCLNMLAMALELARIKPVYEDVATKFFEHFIYIANAINNRCGIQGLWNEEDGFYFDMIHRENGEHIPLKIHSFVGLIPLYAVETLEPDLLDKLPRFKKRMEWFIKYRPEWVQHIHTLTDPGEHGRLLLSLVSQQQLKRALEHMLDEDKFLSPHGLRALSKEHEKRPYTFTIDGQPHTVGYEPAESTSGLFGGNSNWRGPVWFPVNYLMIESLQKYHHYYGNAFQVELPTRSDDYVNLNQAAATLSDRLVGIFLRGKDGKRPFNGGIKKFQTDPHFRDHILFYEYFHGDNGAGIGASHQTGWTALVAKLIQQNSSN